MSRQKAYRPKLVEGTGTRRFGTVDVKGCDYAVCYCEACCKRAWRGVERHSTEDSTWSDDLTGHADYWACPCNRCQGSARETEATRLIRYLPPTFAELLPGLNRWVEKHGVPASVAPYWRWRT